MFRAALPLFAMATIAGCNQTASEPADDASAASSETDAAANDPVASENPAGDDFAWTGHWEGVEGMYLDISEGTEPGHYLLEMQYDLDNSGTYDGVVDGEAIAFERNGETFLLTRGSGEATGLRYLDGKEDCLIVAEGEGYCRD